MSENAVASSLDAWYASGQRLGFDLERRIVDPSANARVFVRTDGDVSRAATFMPGFPDGSVGWSKAVQSLPDANAMPKLFLEYVGMGDSDKPRDYPYSTEERADLVEAMWQYYGVTSTVLVSIDFSSLVILELLARRIERGTTFPEIRGVFIFNGGLFPDGHSHPWFTTPVLRRVPVDKLPRAANTPFFTFKRTARVMWSKRFAAWEREARVVYDALRRHDGLFYLYKAADFVVGHRAQGDRLDFARLFDHFHRTIPFVIGGSLEDPFEPRQILLARHRLDSYNLTIVSLPGGHLTTSEHPSELAQLISRFYHRTSLADDARRNVS